MWLVQVEVDLNVDVNLLVHTHYYQLLYTVGYMVDSVGQDLEPLGLRNMELVGKVC